MFNLNFEIMLTQNDGLYVAHCGNFPECQGYGATENEALNDLADAISCKMAESIKGVINDFVKSGVLENAVRDLDKNKQQESSAFSIESQPTSMGGMTRKIHFSGNFPETNLGKLRKNSEGIKKYPSIFARYLPNQVGLGVGYGLGMPMPELPFLGDLRDPLSDNSASLAGLSGFMISLN